MQCNEEEERSRDQHHVWSDDVDGRCSLQHQKVMAFNKLVQSNYPPCFFCISSWDLLGVYKITLSRQGEMHTTTEPEIYNLPHQ